MKKLYQVEITETGSLWHRIYHVAALSFDHAARRVKTQVRRHEAIHRPQVVAVTAVKHFLP
jgi:hypothetical protein